MGLMDMCVGLGLMAILIGLPWYVVLARQAAKTYAKRTVVYAQDNQIQVRYDSDAVIQTVGVSAPVSQNRPVGFTHLGRTSRAGTIVVGDEGRITVGVGFGQIWMRE
jgi:hypothetical protein